MSLHLSFQINLFNTPCFELKWSIEIAGKGKTSILLNQSFYCTFVDIVLFKHSFLKSLFHSQHWQYDNIYLSQLNYDHWHSVYRTSKTTISETSTFNHITIILLDILQHWPNYIYSDMNLVQKTILTYWLCSFDQIQNEKRSFEIVFWSINKFATDCVILCF